MEAFTADAILTLVRDNAEAIPMFAAYLAALVFVEGALWAKAPASRGAFWKGVAVNVGLLIVTVQLIATSAVSLAIGAQMTSIEKALQSDGRSIDPDFGLAFDGDLAAALRDATVEMLALGAIAAALVLYIIRSMARLTARRLIDAGHPGWLALATPLFPFAVFIVGLLPSRAVSTASATDVDGAPRSGGLGAAMRRIEELGRQASEEARRPAAEPQPAADRAVAASSPVRGRATSDGPAVRR